MSFPNNPLCKDFYGDIMYLTEKRLGEILCLLRDDETIYSGFWEENISKLTLFRRFSQINLKLKNVVP